MALSRVKTWIAGEVLTASDLNSEFNNLINNAVSLISPVAGAFDFDGQTITLDAAGATQVVSSAAVSWNFTSGAKSGTPATTGSVQAFSAQTFTDSNTAGSGTATSHVFYGIAAPTLAATNASVTTTDAATWYIAGPPAAGTNETITNPWALWVDSGNVRFDGDLEVRGSTTLGDAPADTLTINAETVSSPNIPCFFAYNSATDTNQTGNGATATADLDTETFDQSGDFASDTFTAPATGKYLLIAQVRFSAVPAGSTTFTVNIVTTARTYSAVHVMTAGTFSSITIPCIAVADMSATNTATVTVTISGGAGDTASIIGQASPATFFCGMRVA